MGAMISSSNPISLNDIRVALQTNLEVKNTYNYVNSGLFNTRNIQISLDDIDVKNILRDGWVHNGNNNVNTWTQSPYAVFNVTPKPSVSLSQFKGKGIKGTDNYNFGIISAYYT